MIFMGPFFVCLVVVVVVVVFLTGNDNPVFSNLFIFLCLMNSEALVL